MLTFQEMILKLTEFWKSHGCIVHQGHDVETGAGTFNPATFLRCLGPEPYKTVYVEPSRRPSDGRYGENPNRLQLFHQLQVIIKPSPSNIIELYKKSLQLIGIDLKAHDLRFVHDDWESPTIGAHGLGWEVWIDGMEVTQFTYFQAVASLPLKPVSVEITLGLERLCMYVQNKDNVYDIQWNDEYTYGEIVKQNEIEWSKYNFEEASTEMWQRHFDDFESEAKRLIEMGLPLPAYDFVMKASHAFNLLEARGVISVTERTGYIGRIRDLTREIANCYLEMREKLGFPLLSKLPNEKKSALEKGKLPEKFGPKHKETFLLEIGSEALPATFVPIGMRSLENNIKNLLKEHSLKCDSLRVFGTPFRLGVSIEGLVEGSESKTLEKKGPKLEVAQDADGNITKQGLGFLKSVGASSLKDPQIEERNGYLFAKVTKDGKSVYSILQEHLPHLILHLNFPKKMRWGSLDIEYPRPIHTIAAMYGNQIIPFIVGDVLSSNISMGHSQRDSREITLKDASSYFDVLKEHKVIADPKERRDKILEQLEKIKGKILRKEKVLSQVLYLTEWPILQSAEFDPKFLEIPQEVLISEMVEHQKYFPLADTSGKLTNTFLITADNIPSELIIKGNQKVLSARLSDGVFLYNQDLKEPLEEFNKRLGKMLFQKKLGTMLDKVDRLSNVAEKLNTYLGIAGAKKVERAAHLCKADLASAMVGEFPELQGTIGKYYALTQKEDEEVASAIEEHWMPTSESGSLPKTSTGIIISLADKLDNLISYFSVGLKPSSSSDPYSLRRQTIGILKILIENKLSIDLSELLNEEVLTYVTGRAKHVFEDYGFAKDEIEASLAGLCTDPFDQYCQLGALHVFRKTDDFDKLFEVYKRAKGQLEKGEAGQLSENLAKEPAELQLLQVLNKMETPLNELLAQKNYTGAFEQIAKLKEPLAQLFDTVKILADDPKIQQNRLALLQKVFAHFEKLLDFSKIQAPAHGRR